jgi:hypothetical protein
MNGPAIGGFTPSELVVAYLFDLDGNMFDEPSTFRSATRLSSDGTVLRFGSVTKTVAFQINSLTVIPEPANLIFLGIAAVVLSAIRHRRHV